MTITLPELPYDKGELAPYVSAETLDYHHGKHHKGYVDKANASIVGTELEGITCMKELTKKSYQKLCEENYTPSGISLFNNAAQAYNHAFYWKCMKKNGSSNPAEGGRLAELIKKYSGQSTFSDNMQFLIDKLKDAALAQFGSGWGWLIYDKQKGNIDVIKTSNADTPITTEHQLPLLTVDVWEHAYYIDHRNERAKYLDKFFEHLVNWDFAEENLNKIIST